MQEYSSICYRNSFLHQVIVRIDFLQFVPTNMTFSESIEKEILRIFPRRGKDQIIRFNSINVVFDQNNNGLPNANGKVLEGIQREYFTNDGVNKLVLSNKFIVFEINKYSSFEVHKQWFQSILLEFFQRNRVSANRTGIRYNYIDSEDDEGVNVIEFEFPMAIIISQACDVIAMEDIVNNKSGKPAKFMPSILMCPIYDKSASKSGDHIKEAFSLLSLNIVEEPIYFKDDLKTADKDWHYRFHSLTIETGAEKVLENAIVDFKHYFTVPISYLISHKKDRLLHLDDLFAEQITLKFSTYLARVAIP